MGFGRMRRRGGRQIVVAVFVPHRTGCRGVAGVMYEDRDLALTTDFRANYPATPFANALRQTAQLIKAGVGLEVVFTDVGGWDTHVNEGNQQGQLSNLLRNFSSAIAALYTDLGQRMDDVVVLTMSEFGRTARENGNRGTDHGHANAMFIVGNNVRGGKVYGDWPGLKSDQLYEGRDLALTTDFRDVFGEVASKHLGATNLNAVFPGYGGGSSKFRGVLG